MFPGVICLTILFTAIFSAVSIVWDREFGFLREMLVAPVRRGAIMIGKCAGGATVATVQGLIMLVLAPLVHVPYNPVMLVELIALMVITAVMLTALGLFLAARIQEIESFQVVMQLFVLPLFFLSAAVFPIAKLPTWLGTLTRFDPLAYAVDAMRKRRVQRRARPCRRSGHQLSPRSPPGPAGGCRSTSRSWSCSSWRRCCSGRRCTASPGPSSRPARRGGNRSRSGR